MDLSEIKKNKEELELAITSLLYGFEKVTQVIVKDINLYILEDIKTVTLKCEI